MHADASNFRVGITKEDAYKQVLEQAEALFEGQRNWVCFHWIRACGVGVVVEGENEEELRVA